MRDSLYAHYERELRFFRTQAEGFARRHPSMAGALLLRENECQDPHVERLIEAFALMAGRIHQRLDDEYPELTEAMLGVLYPHFLAPVPSMCLIELELDEARSQIPDGFLIDRHARLRSRAVDGLACKYRTCYPVNLWPVKVQNAKVRHPPFPSGLDLPNGTRSILQIELSSLGGLSLAKIHLDTLRFFVAGAIGSALDLYEVILNHTISAALYPIDRGVRDRPLIRRPDRFLAPVGFELDEGLLPYSDRSFPGYRLLTELYAFPSKYLFFEMNGLREAFEAAGERDLEIVLFLDCEASNLERTVDRESFRLGCTPAVNLFEQTAEPIRLDHFRSEYPIVPDVTHPIGMEVYQVESVRGVDSATGAFTTYQPLYAPGGLPGRQTCWVASRRDSSRPADNGTDVTLSLVDQGMDPSKPSDATLVVRALCSNRDLPIELIQSEEGPAFQLDAAAPVSNVRCLVGPSVPHRPAMRRNTQWQIVSHLSLNYLSIVSEPGGVEALRQLLQIYWMFKGPRTGEYPGFKLPERGGLLRADSVISAIVEVSSKRCVATLPGDMPGSFCRGLEIILGIDGTMIAPSEAFLVGAVLDRFFGLYASINSFSRLSIKLQGNEGYLKQWPPRAGTREIL